MNMLPNTYSHRIQTRSIILFGLLFTQLLWTANPAHGAEQDKSSRFDKPIRLELWNKNLSDAVSQITERSGIDLRISPDFVHPREFSSYTLYLYADRISTRQAIEWVCRSINCRYRIDGPSSVWLTGGYDWLKRDTDILIQSIDPVLGPKGDFKELENDLSELVKVQSLFEDYWVRIERPDRKVVAALPPRLKKILVASLLAMTKPGKTIGAAPPPSFTKEETELLKALQARVVASYRARDAQEVIADLALQSGISIGIPPEPFAKDGVPDVTLELGEVTLQKAIEALAEALGLKGYELSPPRGVFLTKEPRKWSTAAGREMLWERLTVESYAIKKLAQLTSGDAVAHHLRRRVSPDIWLDPCTAVVYHEPSGNLIVVAPQNVQDAVMRELHRLQSSPADKADSR